MSVLYLLDACVLIDANRDYYPIERVPEFWEWLLEMGKLDRIKIPQEFYEEVQLLSPCQKALTIQHGEKCFSILIKPIAYQSLLSLTPGP